MSKTACIATLATIDAIQDLRTLLFSLSLFNTPAPKVYLYADSALMALAPKLKYSGVLVVKNALERYAGKTRKEMEQLPGQQFPSLWFDFMAEKITLLEWAFATEGEAAQSRGIFFCDADICFFAPLPKLDRVKLLALSPHEIRPQDEARFGRYNGGFLWMSDPALARAWRQACYGARFFEQSALEDVARMIQNADPATFYEFPRTNNYGWWRLWQGVKSPQEIQYEWTMNRFTDPRASGILIQGQPLGSVHTHFFGGQDKAVAMYNEWVLQWLRRLAAGHPPAKRLLHWLTNGPPKIE